MRINPDIITLLFHEGGATADELAAVTDAWQEQVEHLMKKNEIERYMENGEMRFRWVKKSKIDNEFRYNKKRAAKKLVASKKEKQMTFELKGAINEYWQVKDE